MFYDVYKRLCGENLRTPEEVARTLRIGNATINLWKKGNAPDRKALQKLSDYFGVSEEYLLGEASSSAMTKPSQSPEAQRIRLTSKIMRALNSLTAQELERVYKYISR